MLNSGTCSRTTSGTRSFCTFAGKSIHMTRNLALLMILALAAACGTADREPNVSVTGHFPGVADQRIILEEMEPLRSTRIDSARAGDGGEFSFDLHVPEAGFYVLLADAGEAIVLLLEPGEQLSLGSATGKFDHTAVAKGSPGTQHLLEFERFMEFQRLRVDSLARVYNAHRGEPNFMDLKDILDSLYQVYVDDQRDYILRFIDRDPGSLASLLMINRRLGQASVFDEVGDFAILHRIDSVLTLKYPGNQHTTDHHNRVKSARGQIFDEYVREEKLQPGKKAPDVVLPDTSGIPASLKSFAGQKVILYFWAGWDARSRQVNRKISEIYPRLEKSNVELVGISFDENAVVWKGAIRLDQLPGIQLSDLKGLYSPLAVSYNVADRIPYFYLIDEEQRIEYKHETLDSLLVRLN